MTDEADVDGETPGGNADITPLQETDLSLKELYFLQLNEDVQVEEFEWGKAWKLDDGSIVYNAGDEPETSKSLQDRVAEGETIPWL